ncbi:MAG: adenine phosphoribosyltransferase [Thermoleophilaceae bacterium]|jgi:adenine phosphoribosyltransferase|nr:adenine phosphoribosyltransferase [Thermoleophilaceae bacterium]
MFRDITPLLLHPEALAYAIEQLAGFANERNVDVVAAAEARGFILGGAVARQIGAGFIPVRKPGKLPWDTHSAEYVLEYGVDALEIHKDAVSDGARVLVHDDLLATGGTAAAVCDLIDKAGGDVVGCSFLAELSFLSGREKLPGCDVQSLVVYDSE